MKICQLVHVADQPHNLKYEKDCYFKFLKQQSFVNKLCKTIPLILLTIAEKNSIINCAKYIIIWD